MTTQAVLVCTAYSSDGTACSSQAWVESYVVTPDQQAQLNLLTNGGFDSEMFLTFFMGTLMLFATGFAVGIIISQVRKMRRGV